MKKTISILLVAALMATCLALAVFATETLQFVVEDAMVNCGEEVILKVTLANNPGFTNGCVVVTYDEENLELVDVLVGNEEEYDAGYDAKTTWKGLINHNGAKVNFATTADTTRKHTMFEIVLKVKDNAVKGDYTVGIEVEYIKNNAEEDIATQVTAGTIHACAFTDVPDTAATCTANGYKAHRKCACNKCYVDGVEVTAESVTIPALGHQEVTDAAVAPTCTTAGKTEGKHCSVCGEVTVAQQVVAATGHAEVVDTGVAATCTEPGLTDGKHCATCNEVLVAQVEIPAIGHIDADGNILCDACGFLMGEVKVEVKPDFTEEDIPEELQDTEFDTIEEIEEEMQTQIVEELNAALEGTEETKPVVIKPEDTFLYEVVLMYEDKDGNMQEADKEHFPEDGKLTVTLAVPEGTDPETHKYHVVHMFTTSAFGKTPGDVEIFTDLVAELDENGVYVITFEVTGLSPIMICAESRGTMGDVNGDGKVNSTDAKLIMQYELGLIDATVIDTRFADVNDDGKINTTDAKLVMQFELGSISEFPATKKE